MSVTSAAIQPSFVWMQLLPIAWKLNPDECKVVIEFLVMSKVEASSRFVPLEPPSKIISLGPRGATMIFDLGEIFPL